MPRGWERRGATIRAYVTVDGRRYWRTFPATARDEDIQLWRAQTRRRQKWLARAGVPLVGTLEEDVTLYLSTFTGRHPETQSQRQRHLEDWARAFRGRTRESLQPAEIEAQLASWREERHYTPATLAKVRQSLYQLYAVLDRGTGVNPVDAVPTPAAAPLQPRGVPMAVVAQLLARIKASKTKARLTLIAYAGLRPSEIRRIQAEDWDETSLLVRTGKGGEVARVPLLRPARAALEYLGRKGALGGFTNAPLGKAMREACAALTAAKKLKAPLHVRPYDLRHSLGSAVYQHTGDQRAAQAALRHKSIVTTHRYTLAAVDPRLTAAFDAIGAAVPALQLVPKEEPRRKARR